MNGGIRKNVRQQYHKSSESHGPHKHVSTQKVSDTGKFTLSSALNVGNSGNQQ